MEILTDKELDFLKEEAKKIKAIDHLKEIAKKHDLLFPDSNKPEEKKRLLEDHNRRKKATNKAIKLVSRVDIEIVEEGIYEPKDQTLKKEYCVLTKIICKSSDPEDQIFTEVTLGSGVNFFLSYTIDQILQERLNNYRTESKKKPLFKKSGQLVYEILKTTPQKSNPLDLFSELSEETKSELEQEGIEITRELFSGINLTASEMKIQDVFSILLYQQSQTKDSNKPGYYTGAKPEQIRSYLGGKETIAPGIELSFFSIAKEFTGKKNPSGKDLENVKGILDELGKKKFLMRHIDTYTNKKTGAKATIDRTGYRTLFDIDEADFLLEDKDGNQTAKGKTFIVVLNPIYRETIKDRFILQPVDILQQLALATGSPNIPLALHRLKEYLFQIIAQKPKGYPEHKIGARKLYEKLEPKLMERPRLTLARDNTTKAIQTLVKMEIIDRYELGKNNIGEDMYTFYINKNYLQNCTEARNQ
jgi:hypothetical protein